MATEKTPVSLMAEAVATHRSLEGRYKSACQTFRPWEIRHGLLVELPEASLPTEYSRIKRIEERAFSRYLRRWANACENGYQGEWFEPWLPQRASK